MDSQKFLEVTREPAKASRACQGAGDDSGTGASALPIQEDGAKHLILAGKLVFAEFALPHTANFHTQREQRRCYKAACQRNTYQPGK